ncbi:MAG: tRNA (adenosine(37)-N6)-threonylcarbamoyltransferase complex ATPase subunit type 1 TsaE [Patescibacteria group bacterium]
MEKIFHTKNLKETQNLSEKAIEIAKKQSRKNAAVLGLVGDLGGGKTSFTQGLAKNLGIKKEILSPTFILMQSYPLSGKKFPWKDFYHLDAYRVKSSKEILRLGFEEIIKDSQNIVVVEWADIIKDIMPKNTLWIEFEWLDENERKITLN